MTLSSNLIYFSSLAHPITGDHGSLMETSFLSWINYKLNLLQNSGHMHYVYSNVFLKARFEWDDYDEIATNMMLMYALHKIKDMHVYIMTCDIRIYVYVIMCDMRVHGHVVIYNVGCTHMLWCAM